MCDLLSHWLAELWQDATCPESQKSPSTILQHQAPAPHSTAQHCRALQSTLALHSLGFNFLFLRYSSPLFQYQQTLGQF